MWALLFGLAGWWTGLRRFLLVGGWIFLMGLAIGVWQWARGVPDVPVEFLRFDLWASLPDSVRLLLEEIFSRLSLAVGGLTLVTGAGLLLSGGIAFWRYRRENPAPVEEEA